jgi:hypothetical protein
MTDQVKREAARTRKRKQRERAREAARLAAEELAARREISDERLAPAVMRNPVMRPDGSMLVGARVSIVHGRAMHSDPISNLAKNSPLFGDRHKFAARRLQQDVNDVGAGVNASAVDLMGAGGGRGDGTGGHLAILDQIATRERLQSGLATLGGLVSGVVRVVIDCLPVTVWACEAGLETKDALQQVSAGLLRLANFYNPPAPDHPIHGNLRSLYASCVSGAYAPCASGAV